jgi:protein-export SecD/SecF family membrane protein
VRAGGAEPLKLQRTEFVGPLRWVPNWPRRRLALAFTVVGIMIYLAFRFEWKFAVAGIIANLHDVVIILGFFAFFQWEFSLAVLAAVLAVLGYSVNESVVIFDRVREAFRKYRKLSTPQVIDHAITSTISRTIITHGSTQMMVLSMLLFGGPTLHYFAVALTIGILFGIYSSVFVAAAIAMWLGVKREDLVKPTRSTTRTIRTPAPWCRVDRQDTTDPTVVCRPWRPGAAPSRSPGQARRLYVDHCCSRACRGWCRRIGNGPRELLDKPAEHALCMRRRDLVQDLQKLAGGWHGPCRMACASAGSTASRLAPGDLPPGGRTSTCRWSTTTPSSARSSPRGWRWPSWTAPPGSSPTCARAWPCSRPRRTRPHDMLRAHVLARVVFDAWRSAGLSAGRLARGCSPCCTTSSRTWSKRPTTRPTAGWSSSVCCPMSTCGPSSAASRTGLAGTARKPRCGWHPPATAPAGWTGGPARPACFGFRRIGQPRAVCAQCVTTPPPPTRVPAAGMVLPAAHDVTGRRAPGAGWPTAPWCTPVAACRRMAAAASVSARKPA